MLDTFVDGIAVKRQYFHINSAIWDDLCMHMHLYMFPSSELQIISKSFLNVCSKI